MANKTPSAKGHQWDLLSQVEVGDLSPLVVTGGHNLSRPQHEVWWEPTLSPVSGSRSLFCPLTIFKRQG